MEVPFFWYTRHDVLYLCQNLVDKTKSISLDNFAFL